MQSKLKSKIAELQNRSMRCWYLTVICLTWVRFHTRGANLEWRAPSMQPYLLWIWAKCVCTIYTNRKRTKWTLRRSAWRMWMMLLRRLFPCVTLSHFLCLVAYMIPFGCWQQRILKTRHIGKCEGITITAYAAAHTIGGTIWKIKQDTDEIVYAVDFNHRKEWRVMIITGTNIHANM